MSWRGRISSSVRELRFHYCPVTPAHNGVKSFVHSQYGELKTLNPTTPFLVRDRKGAPAKIWARYDYGEEKSKSVDGASVEQVEEALKELVELGENMPRSLEGSWGVADVVLADGTQVMREEPQSEKKD